MPGTTASIRNSSGVTIQNNNIHDADNGVVIYGGPGANVSGNTIDYVGSDVMKFSGLSNATISGNKSYGHIYPSAAAHPDFMQFEATRATLGLRTTFSWHRPSATRRAYSSATDPLMASTFQTI